MTLVLKVLPILRLLPLITTLDPPARGPRDGYTRVIVGSRYSKVTKALPLVETFVSTLSITMVTLKLLMPLKGPVVHCT